LTNLSEKSTIEYSLKKKGNGVYVFIIEGNVNINGEELQRRDGLGLWGDDRFSITAESNAEVLLMEVPML
jgi:redox-sensitive bicupin YhaK (pirin superfamily)